MKQYCRNCCHLSPGAPPWCGKREETVSKAAAGAPNRCHDFAYTPIDALGEDGRKDILRKPKKEQCEGQIRLF